MSACGEPMSSIGTLWRVTIEEGPRAAFELVVRRILGPIIGNERLHYSLVALADHWHDWRHGTNTGGVIPLARLHIGEKTGREYVAVPERTWKLIFRHLPVNVDEFTYVDLGCGKGRTLLFAAERGFRRIIGVDHSPELLEIAHANIMNAELVCCDAARYEFPDEPLVGFLYNPFYADVMTAVAANLADSVKRHPREVYIAYFNPIDGIWDAAGFQAIRRCDALYPRYVIYTGETRRPTSSASQATAS